MRRPNLIGSHDESRKQKIYISNYLYLKEAIMDCIDRNGLFCDLNHIVISSEITSIYGLFAGNEFNGDISKWDVSHIKNMSSLFAYSAFNEDISNWDVSSVVVMDKMFRGNERFNSDISKWDTSSVRSMSGMFSTSVFDGDIGDWDVSNVEAMGGMFMFSKFSQDISKWDTHNVINMTSLFQNTTTFNHDLSGWDVSNVKYAKVDSDFWEEKHRPKYVHRDAANKKRHVKKTDINKFYRFDNEEKCERSEYHLIREQNTYNPELRSYPIHLPFDMELEKLEGETEWIKTEQ